ncbi:steroid 5-alpha reductase family enzyme [Mumia flava]|uniref:Steroid 5-alpha reductase family enzyme n=1 Tax=Mumia flava TaxID=1348852 RepID=A0A0B2BL19_9ACTN|nr:DUF1295 domain-containing protein [Mumia flava]PJJ56821.1 steroid 5-alpha reductase family enzyme [Mumia flava]
MTFEWTALLVVSGASLAAVVVVMAATALVARRVGRVSVVDVAWGLAFVAVAIVCLPLALVYGTADRSLLLAVLVAAWGVRLAVHIGRRAGGKEDPRYEKLLAKAPGDPYLYALRTVFALQGALVWLISFPLQVTAVSGGSIDWVAGIGAALILVGIAFEAIGDAQLAAFKADPAHRGMIMDRGLWAWTRHPNYFGDACVWWGVFVVAAAQWPGVFTVVSPLIMTYLLVWGSGARMTERVMADRPGFAEYRERTSGFFPLPPRRSATAVGS